MALKLSGRERSRRIIDIIAHQCGTSCPKERRAGLIKTADRRRRQFWSKEAASIKRPDGPIGELLLLETCVYRCVSSMKEHINSWER